MTLRTILSGDRGKADLLLADGKRFLSILKNAMSFQNLQQLSKLWRFEDGSSIFVQSVFGQDLISINAVPLMPALEEGEEAYYIFLVALGPQYVVWRIGDGSPSPSNFKIGDYITLFNAMPGVYTSTVKSNSTLDKHYVMVQNCDTGLSRYGIKEPSYCVVGGYYVDMLHGLRNSYVKEKGSDEVLDTSFAYFNHNTDLNSPPAYVCSGRNNWYKDGDSIVTDLELWKEDSSTYKVKCKIDGVDSEGSTFPNGKFAVLSKSKFIGYGPTAEPVTVQPDTLQVWNDYCGHLLVYGTSYTSTGGNYYMFGDTVLETVEGSIQSQTTGYPSSSKCLNDDDAYVSSSVIDNRSNSLVSIIDYDNLNIDKTFVCFYSLLYGSYKSSGTDYTTCAISGDGWSGSSYQGSTTDYIFAYKLPSSGVVRIEACSYFTGTFIHRTVSVGGYCEIILESFETGSTSYGQRLRDVSCKASDKYLVYTYAVEDYVSPGVWSFNKRVLGVINAKTGKHNIYVVDDSLLGDNFKDTFDESKRCAIGIHKAMKEVVNG